MKQGQICKIQAHEGQDPLFSEHIGKDGGWFLKAKGRDGKVMFHLVDGNRTIEMNIPLNLVDESLKNENPTKPYYVVFVIPENIQPLVTSVSSKMDSMATQTCAEAKVNSLYEAKAIATANLENAKKKVAFHTVEDWDSISIGDMAYIRSDGEGGLVLELVEIVECVSFANNLVCMNGIEQANGDVLLCIDDPGSPVMRVYRWIIL